ncbi:MAG: AgmX/PglI C-terminal domain-containing protein [Myxococcales bacterium]
MTVKTLRLLAIALAIALPATGLAADTKDGKKDSKVEGTKPNLGEFKLDTSPSAAGGSGATGASGSTGATGAAASDPNQPAKPAKKELDVSRMLFDGEGVRQVVKFYMPEIQECYERVLADTGSKLEGRVVVGFIVDTNGNVTDARVLQKKSTLKNDRVHDCVLKMKYWAFPKPGDNRDHPIEYPFDLKVSQ